MLRKLLKYNCILAIIFIAENILAQTPLNEVSDFGYHQQNIRSMLIKDDQVYVSGIVLRKNNNQEREFFVSKINKLLEPIDHYLLDDDNDLIALQNQSHDLICHNGKLYSVASEEDFSNTQNEFATIIEYDPTTNNLSHYIKEDTLFNGFTALPATLISDLEKENLLVLYTGLNNLLLNTIWLVKYDFNTKEIIDEYWYEETNNSITGFEIISGNEGYTIIGRRQFTDGSSSELIVLKISENLELEDSLTINNYNYSDLYIDAIEASDGSTVFMSSESIGEFPRDSFRKKVIKVDPNLDLQWETTIGNPNYTRDFLTTTEIINSTQDEGYLFCGAIDNGVIGKLSQEGDSVWLRTYEPIMEDKALFSTFSDIESISAGEYIIAGQSAPEAFETDSIFFKIWMIKINENGHILNRDTTGVSTIEAFDGKLRIFPNPTSEFLYIEQDNLKSVDYELYNLRGQLVLKKENTKAYHTCIVSLQDFDSGIYYLHTIDQKGNRTINEVVVLK